MTSGADRDTIVGTEGATMHTKSVISLTTGLEDPEKVTVAFLVAVGSAEGGRPTLMFLTKEAVRLVAATPRAPTPARGARRSRTWRAGTPRPAVATWCAPSASTRGTSTRVTCWPTPARRHRADVGVDR